MDIYIGSMLRGSPECALPLLLRGAWLRISISAGTSQPRSGETAMTAVTLV